MIKKGGNYIIYCILIKKINRIGQSRVLIKNALYYKIIECILINMKQTISSDNKYLQYEINEMILSSSVNEEETPFVFMDGIAIQIESIDNPIPVKSPVILTYPRKDEVIANSKMCKEIANFRGYEWDGNFYSIALKYEKVNSIKYSR